MSRRLLAVLLTAMSVTCMSAHARDLALGRNADDPPAQPPPPPAFRQGTWDLELNGAYVHPIRFSDDKFYNVNIGLGYCLLDNLSITGNLEGYYADQPDNSAVLGGAGLMLRAHLIHIDRLTLYLDAGGSATLADKPVPEFGTHFNFTVKGGAGATWRLRDGFYLEGGARYFHLSNGNLHGRDQNPSFDGIEYYGGMMWTF